MVRGGESRCLLVAALLIGLAVPRLAQGDPADGAGIRFGKDQVQQWRVGVIITAVGGPCRGLRATVPVPTGWPEQQVRVVQEDVGPPVQRVDYRMLDGGVQQMLVLIPALNAGETARALVTFEVTRREILAPADPALFRLPERAPRDVMKYLAASPYIESTHPQIRDLAREILQEQPEAAGAWERVEAFYDYVREHVAYRNGTLKGALAALRDGSGDCEELTSLFIALCRASKIPARTVWVPDHCYPEFYLQDAQGRGHWFPCQAAGTRAFGGIPELRPILQKGDNFQVPEQRERQRYVAEFLKGTAFRGGGQPQVEFVRELLPADP